MKTYNVQKHALVEVNDKEINAMGIIAVQMVTFTINFFGHEETFDLDTRIYNDGRQEVTDGNGWIPAGTLI